MMPTPRFQRDPPCRKGYVSLFTFHISPNYKQGLSELHRLAILDQNGLDDASLIRVDLVEQLHCLDNAQGIAAIDVLTNIDKWLGTG